MANERFQISGTRLGPVLVVRGGHGLLRVELPGKRYGDLLREVLETWPDARDEAKGLVTAVRAVVEFFDVGRQAPRRTRLDLSAASAFDRAVYDALRETGPGEAVTYAELARRIGRPGAHRAVGSAVARNPLPLFVPCHRVVRADGKPGGYRIPGGIPLKQEMLRLECMMD